MLNKKAIIIGSGFSSLSTGCYLTKQGLDVTIYEKNPTIGGRARSLETNGFRFDMGPSWYWMPDVFEKFFNDFGKEVSDYYTLQKLSPAYEVVLKNNSIIIPDNLQDIYKVFDNIESGSGAQLKKFIELAKDNYNTAIKDLVYMPGNKISELITKDTIKKAPLFFQSVSHSIKKYITHPDLVKLLEFPALFLGAKPENTPAFYSFMNYADYGLGTWYPEGGMTKVIEGMSQLFSELGGKIITESPVSQIIVKNKTVRGIKIGTEEHYADYVISGADYAHTEKLLDKKFRMYSEAYWNKKVFAPSALLFYVGFNEKLKNITHHMLFFDEAFEEHATDIYTNPKWPKSPLFYANFPSLTDTTCAPENKETGFFLIPIAPGITDNEQIRNKYFSIIINRLEKKCKIPIKSKIDFVKTYCIKDFEKDYNAYKGNAYGMANTLMQTAFLRPKIKSKKVKNLYFTGQLTVPGPGVPPAIISGKIAATELIKDLTKNKEYEEVV